MDGGALLFVYCNPQPKKIIVLTYEISPVRGEWGGKAVNEKTKRIKVTYLKKEENRCRNSIDTYIYFASL